MKQTMDTIQSIDPSHVSLRRCTRPTGAAPESGDASETICGWRFFDQVVFLVDISQGAAEHAGETVRCEALSCRSCGALQPDGIPPAIAARMTDVEICSERS